MQFLGRFIQTEEEFFKCEQCGLSVDFHAKCIVPDCREDLHSLEGLKNHFEIENKDDADHQKLSPFKELNIAGVNAILETTVKKDEVSKGIAFLNMVNAQTAEDQFNIMFSASSSSGKSYIPLEIAAYFPESEVVTYSGASPTSFFHEKGIIVIELEDQFVPADTLTDPIIEEIDSLKAKEEKTPEDKASIRELERKVQNILSKSKILVDLEGKILIFVDQPNSKLLEKLRPFLSHDSKHIEVPITDKAGHGGNRTKHVILRGFAAVFFCTVSANYDDQEANRNFILSPESSQPKIEEALILLDEKLSNRELFRDKLEENPARCSLIMRIELLRLSGIKRVITDKGVILPRFRELHRRLQTRATRDFVRLYSLIYAHALLNLNQRTKEDAQTIVASVSDIDAAFSLYTPIMQANESGVSPEVYNLLIEIIIPAYTSKLQDAEIKNKSLLEDKREIVNGISFLEIAQSYLETRRQSISLEKVKSYCRALEMAGLASEETDAKDRRKPIVRPILSGPAHYAFQNTLENGQAEGQIYFETRSAPAHELLNYIEERSAPRQLVKDAASSEGMRDHE